MMKAISIFLIVAALALTGCQKSASPQPLAAEPYVGFQQDLAALRDTAPVSRNDPALLGSSGKAIEAARRVFTKGNLVGKTKAEAITLLGDPETLSSYGVAATPEKNSPLIYRFDSGWGGWVYTLHFTDGKVIRIEEQGMY